MNKFGLALFCCALALAGTAAEAQTSARIRGTVTAFDGKVLAVKSRDGRDLQLQFTDKTTVVGTKAITLADLKPGDFVGSTTMRDPDGALVAREVHTLARTSTEGSFAWDLEPGSNMTNANVAKTVKSANGHELVLEFKGGSQTIKVPDGTPVVTTVAADRSLLVSGAYVFISAQVDAEGRMTALRIQATMDGVRPPH